jgi:hypothetical protein
MELLVALSAHRHELPHQLITHVRIGVVMHFGRRSLEASLAGVAITEENLAADASPLG